MSKKTVLLLAAVLALSFFGFVDDKYRGFDDTNQYQLEAKAWANGQRPPVKELSANTSGLINQFSHHGPVLTPFVWSFLVTKGDWRINLWRIKVFQAVLIAASFMLLLVHLGADTSALIVCTLFFAINFFGEAVMTPLTEPMTVFLMILSFTTSATGILFVLQALNRTPVAVLHGDRIWSSPRRWRQISLALLSFGAAAFYFGTLIRGTKVSFYGPENWYPVLKTFSKEAVAATHLLPYNNEMLLHFWTVLCTGFLLWVLFRARKKPLLMLGMGLYLLVILSVAPQGFRYFLPFFLVWILEFKPRWPDNKIVRGALVLLALHFGFQQIENIRSFRRYPIPETESPGLQATKNWIKENEINNVMMYKFRYCINYFEIQCYTIPDNFTPEGLIKDLKDFHITHVIFSGVPWLFPEDDLHKLLEKVFKKQSLELTTYEKQFKTVKIVDVRPLKL